MRRGRSSVRMPASGEVVLDFWFGPPGAALEAAERNAGRWWGKDPSFDAEIGRRFAGLIEAVSAREAPAWKRTPRGRLAALVVLDQLPRNAYRATAAAFAHDAAAQALCLEGLAQGADRALAPIERVFFYLPLEHAESSPQQARSVAAFERLLADAPEGERPLFAGFLDYAERHRSVVDRFGRFPHRNALLGRESTAAEVAFLAEPGSSF